MKKIIFAALAVMTLMLVSCNSELPEGEFNQREAKKMLALVNDFRTGSEAFYVSEDGSHQVSVPGLGKLEWNSDLEEIAKVRAAEISKSFSHTRPDGSSCWTAYEDSTIFWWGKGENIAAGQSSYETCFSAWKEEGLPYAKQGHRRNMLGDYNSIGIACFVPEDDTLGYRKYWVMELGKK